MKKITIMMAVASFLMLLASCSKEHIDTKATDIAGYQFETFKGEVNKAKGMPKESWQRGDELALYGLDMPAFNLTDAPTKWTFVDSQNAKGNMTPMVCNNPDPDAQDWSYGAPIAWYNGVTTSFIAIYPYEASEYTLPESPAKASDIVVNYSVVGGYYPGIAFEADIEKARNDTKKQTDMLVALTKDLNNETLSVPLNFRHTLSQIRFTITNAAISSDKVIRVHDITINGVFTSGQFSFSGNEEASAPALSQWKNHTDPRSFTVNLGSDVDNIRHGQTVEAAASDDKALMLLPQTLSSNATLSITHSYSEDGGTNWFDKQSTTIELTGIRGNKWEPNINYTYNLRIAPSGGTTTFSSSEENWRD